MGFPHLLPFQFFVYFSPKRSRVLETWGDCYAQALGTWGWKEKPLTPDFNNPFEMAWGEGQCHPPLYDVRLSGKMLNSYTFCCMKRQEAVFLYPLHIFTLPHITTGHGENIRNGFCVLKIVLTFLSLWGDLTALYWYFFALSPKGKHAPWRHLATPNKNRDYNHHVCECPCMMAMWPLALHGLWGQDVNGEVTPSISLCFHSLSRLSWTELKKVLWLISPALCFWGWLVR